MRKHPRLARAVAAAVVAGAIIVGPLGIAPAGAGLETFSATGTGFALRVTIDLSGLPDAVKTAVSDNYTAARDALPAEAQAELPEDFPFVVDQYFARTTADASNSVTKATSSLGDGFLQLASVEANSKGEETHNSQSLQVPPPAGEVPVDISVVDAVTGVIRATVADGPRVDGEATIAEVNATLANVGALLPAEVQAAYDAVVVAVNDAVTTAEAEIDAAMTEVAQSIVDASEDPALDPITSDPVLGPLVDDVVGGATDTTTLATQLATDVNLPSLPDPLAVDVAKVSDIVNETIAQQTADKSSADAVSRIKAMNVLDGFLSVGLIDLASHSEAAGTAGSASNAASCSIADVRLGGEEAVAVDGTGIYVNGTSVPVVGDTVATLQTQVDSVLAALGVTIDLCDETSAAAAEDGSSASQSVSAFVLTLEPTVPDLATLTGIDADLPSELDALGLQPGDALAKVTIDPTVQTAVSAQPQVSNAQLPRTGAPAVATLISGLLLTAGAIAIRRRVR